MATSVRHARLLLPFLIAMVLAPGEGHGFSKPPREPVPLLEAAANVPAMRAPVAAPPSAAAYASPAPAPPIPSCKRTLTARVVAIDQIFTYNRFGSFNPVGVIYALQRDVVPIGGSNPGPGNARLRDDKRPRPLVLRANVGDCLDVTFTNWLAPVANGGGDMPAGRSASFHVNGLSYRNTAADGAWVGRNDSSLAAPGQTRTYRLYADREGTFLVHSMGTSAGGEGDGGTTTLGLFGAITVEPADSVWYRSHVRADELLLATVGTNPDGTPRLNYAARDPRTNRPVLQVLDGNEIVHSELDAIITGFRVSEAGTVSSTSQRQFREFTVVFHDELKAVQAFGELDLEPFHGIRDGFGINYGASGMGSILLANRKKIGPTADCAECKYEEFFLTSWANGDPAVLVDAAAGQALFPADPSNVSHSYLGDPVRIRNLHAGPKETHVFHLHAHQWLKNPSNDRSTYLDSQSIGPGSTFTYDIAYGGGGNRNLTPGDAIYHCHLYPHFAQGMWGLWRNHDTFEAGTPDRNLPDGELAVGTPTPALVPLPGRPMPPMPTYEPSTRVVDGKVVTVPPMPGYPHYIAAKAGRRPPQAPLDLVHDGGLPRHTVGDVHETRDGATILDAPEILSANLVELPLEGTPAEKAAMDFHAGLFPGATRTTARYGWSGAAYPGYTPEGRRGSFLINGQPPRPGAPFADPCPTGAPIRRYDVSYVQMDLVVNEAGWHDPQARMVVLDQDVEATLAGTRPPEPFFFRANSGDCIEYRATNLLPNFLEEDDFQVRTPTDTVGQHIHLVKFDVTSSDGSANGWNYEDGTFGNEEVLARIEAANVAGGIVGTGGSRRRLHPEHLPGRVEGAQTTAQRWWADPLVGSDGADRTLRTVFTHDHFAPSSHQHHGMYAALIIEPAGSIWRDPETGERFGTRADGGPTSWRADILGGNARESIYREFNMAFADFALLYDAYGEPVNPPTAREAPLPIAIEHPRSVRNVEAISAADPGGMLINYANEPIPLRIAEKGSGKWRLRSGERGKIHNVFRSDLHGDPFTPVMRAYEGDRVQINLVQGAQEEQHVFSMHGQRWDVEIGTNDGGYTNAQGIGISEHIEFLLAEGLATVSDPLGAADYMYQSAPTDDLWNGMWGILRAYGGPQRDLIPLPNNRPSPEAETVNACPIGARKRSYVVHAITARGNLPGDRLVYNYRFGLYDPDAILFVRAEHLAALRNGTRRPEPLILRANAGECISVKLVNELPAVLQKTPHWNYNPPITEHFNTNQVPISNQVSLHAQLVEMDIGRSDGATVGFNRRQHALPGGSYTYEWYAGRYDLGATGTKRRSAIPIEFGAINLRSMADVVNHGVHGAVGALIIEPPGSTWLADPGSDAQATINYRDRDGREQSFREFVLILQDEVPLHSDDRNFQCSNPQLKCGTALRNIAGNDDAEGSGHKAFNYRTEPFWARLGVAPHLTEDHRLGLNGRDLSSILVGDPETPIFTARAGQPIRMRILAPSAHPRQHGFTLYGHAWPRYPWVPGSSGQALGDNPGSFVIGNQDGWSAMTAFNILPRFGAGGPFRVPMDYLYRDQASFQFSNGLWGILRVLP